MDENLPVNKHCYFNLATIKMGIMSYNYNDYYKLILYLENRGCFSKSNVGELWTKS